MPVTIYGQYSKIYNNVLKSVEKPIKIYRNRPTIKSLSKFIENTLKSIAIYRKCYKN